MFIGDCFFNREEGVADGIVEAVDIVRMGYGGGEGKGREIGFYILGGGGGEIKEEEFFGGVGEIGKSLEESVEVILGLEGVL